MADIPKYLKEKIENFKRGITTVGSDTFNYAVGSCCCSLIGEYAVKCDEMIEARQNIKSADADYRRFKEIIKELIDFAKDDDSGVRLKSIELMSSFQTPEIKELLEFKSIRDPSPRVQKAAKKALEAYSKPQEAPLGP